MRKVTTLAPARARIHTYQDSTVATVQPQGIETPFEPQPVSKPRVAHFVRGWLLPAQTFIGNQIRSLRHHDPIVLSHHRLNEPHPFSTLRAFPLLETLPAYIRQVEKFSHSVLKSMTPAASRQALRLLLQSGVRLLHIHFLVDARFFLPVIRRASIPTVVSGYGYDVSSFPRKLRGIGLWYLRPLFKENITFLAMSNDMRNDLLRLGCPESKIIVHYYGTEVERFLFPERQYQERKTLHLLVVCRLVPKKGIAQLLKAVHFAEENKLTAARFTVTIIGDGPLSEELRLLAISLGIADRVVFRGHVSHEDKVLVDAYKEADIFVLPSMTVNNEKEGIPGTLIEAMASGLPVISTRHAGIPEVVTHEENGLLVEEGHVEALAISLARMASDVALRKRLGLSAMATASAELDLQERTKNLETIYSTLIRQHDQAFR